MSATASPAPSGSNTPTTVNRHVQSATDRQRAQLEKLLKDPAKPAHVPAAPKDKALRAPREMMKNVQGSSAGAGSGEFHVYKASRRREYERLKLMEEDAAKEALEAEFDQRKLERESQADAKTAKNRAKRQKKKVRAKGKGADGNDEDGPSPATAVEGNASSAPLKKRRLVNGKELVFRRPGEESEDEDAEEGPARIQEEDLPAAGDAMMSSEAPAVIEVPRIIIHDE